MKCTLVLLCLCLALVVGPEPANPQVTDTVPVRGRIRIGLTERVPFGEERVLSLWLVTEDSFPDTGYRLATEVTRSAGRQRINILGVYKTSGFAGMLVSPASVGEVLDLPVGPMADTLEIAHQGVVDRYLLWRTPTHAFIRPRDSSLTVLPADSLELVTAGLVMVECSPAGYPQEDCEEFLSGLLPLGTNAELLDPTHDLATRAFGSTLAARHSRIKGPDLRVVIAHGVSESEIQRVIGRAQAFLNTRTGPASLSVTLRAWDGRSVTCRRNECR